jgi:hypothetical protein
MDSATVKESRRVLRRIQDHLYLAHSSLGAQRESVGLVDVMHHPTSALASLNYVTPRRSTAWVSSDMIEQGLAYMRQIGRIPRVHYIEGLFPPPFAKNLLDLGLKAEWELPLMAYLPGGFNGQMPPPLRSDPLPPEIRIEQAADERGGQLWGDVGHSAAYEVATLGVEPLLVGQEGGSQPGQQMDVLMYFSGLPVGAARLSIQEDTAHLLALALKKQIRTPELAALLMSAAVRAAVAQKCTLIYAPGETDADRQMARALGFMDFGSIVCYAANTYTTGDIRDDRILGQPVLALR